MAVKRTMPVEKMPGWKNMKEREVVGNPGRAGNPAGKKIALPKPTKAGKPKIALPKPGRTGAYDKSTGMGNLKDIVKTRMKRSKV